MENMNMDKKVCGEGCTCKSCQGGASCGGMQGCHGHGRHHLVKIILKLVIIIIIFWCGYQLGMMTGILRAGYGHTNFGMMRGGYNLPVNGGATVVPATPAQ